MPAPSFSNFDLLLHCNGSNGDGSFPDSSSRNHAVTVHGDVHVDTTDGDFLGGCAAFDGSGDWLEIPISQIGLADYTLEFKLKASSIDDWNRIFATSAYNSAGGFAISKEASTGKLYYVISDGGTRPTIRSNASVVDGVARRFAIQRRDGVIEMYAEGVKQTETAADTPHNLTSTTLRIGRGFDEDSNASAATMAAKLDEICLTIGEAVYSGDYTPLSSQIPDQITALGIPSEERMGQASVRFTVVLAPAGIGSDEAMGIPALRRHPDTVTALGIPSDESVGVARADAYFRLLAVGIGSEEAMGSVATAVTIEWGLSLTITDPAEDVEWGLRLQIVPDEDVEWGLQLSVLDPAVFAGLNGAGGWAPAPDGRWQAVVLLDGADISDRLIGTVTVRCADNEARTADFAFSPAAVIAPMGLVGRKVSIAFAARGPNGEVLNAQTLFTGVVEQPNLDADTGVVRCVCTDQLQEVMANTTRAWWDAEIGGRWHLAVSGEPEDNRQYAFDRLASVPKSVALDALQRPVVLPWRSPPRSVTIRDADFFDGSSAGALSVDLPGRSQLRTRIKLRMQYRYEVLRNRGFVTQWSKPVRWFIDGPDGVDGPLQWLTTQMVEGALGGLSGWELVGKPFIEHPLAGVYPLGSGINAGAYTITADVAQDLAVGWRAYLRHRWQQTRTEDYTITLVAPNLESLAGQPVEEQMGASLEGPAPDPAWHADREVKPRFAAAGSPGGIVGALVGDTVKAYPETDEAPEGYDRPSFEEAMRTLLDQAWVRLDAAARSGRVRLSLPCRPDLWLDTWVNLETARLRAAGKIVDLTHTLDAAAGTAITELAIAVGLPGAVPAALPTWTLPATPDPDTPAAAARPLGATSAVHHEFVGGLATSPVWDEDSMIGVVSNTNAFMSDATKAARNWYPYQLTIQAPEIDAADRDPLDLPVSVTYEADVPTDLLELL